MPRTAARYTQADAARVIRGAAQSGVPVAIDFLRDGTIRVLVNSGINQLEQAAAANEPLISEPEPEL